MGTSQEKSAPSPSDVYRESLRQPVWHVIVLNSLTFLLYSPVWFFKNWQQLRSFASEDLEKGSDLSAGAIKALRSIQSMNPYLAMFLLLIPIVNILVSSRFIANVASISPGESPIIKRYPLGFGVVLTLLMAAAVLGFGRLPGLGYLLFLTAGLPLALVQHLLNRFWQRVEPNDLTVRQAFSVGELITLIVGSLWLGLIVVGYMTGMSANHS